MSRAVTSGGPQQDRIGKLLPEQDGTGVDLGGIDENVGAQTNLVKPFTIPTHRNFIGCPTHDVSKVPFGETLLGHRF